MDQAGMPFRPLPRPSEAKSRGSEDGAGALEGKGGVEDRAEPAFGPAKGSGQPKAGPDGRPGKWLVGVTAR